MVASSLREALPFCKKKLTPTHLTLPALRSHTPTQVDPTNGDMAIVSGAGKNILVNNVNIIAELERRKSEADSVQTALDEYKQQSVKDHEVLESKFNQAEEARKKAEEANRVLQAAAAQAEQVRAADIADLTARLKAAEDVRKRIYVMSRGH